MEEPINAPRRKPERSYINWEETVKENKRLNKIIEERERRAIEGQS